VTPIRDSSSFRAGTALCSDVLASAAVRITMGMLPGLRQRPGPGIGEALPATILRHADEQTVAALAAVLHAIRDSGMNVADFRDWGIVATPCFLGRATLAVALQRLAAEGAWGISPHFIPHRSQHAVSGTISQVLKIYGPNLGAGGGPGGVLEALLAGSVLLDAHRPPGVWIVMTGWEPEAIPDMTGCINPEAVCHALALALVGARPGWQGVRLRVGPRAKKAWADPAGVESGVKGPGPGQSVPQLSQLQALLSTLAQEDALPDPMVWLPDGSGWIELGKGLAVMNGSRPEIVPWSGNRVRVAVQKSGVGTENKR
jgi:hypothetical protein